MGIRDWFRERRLERLRRDLLMLQESGKDKTPNFNPAHFKTFTEIAPDLEFTISVQENLAWFIGKPRLLRQFYGTHPIVTGDLKYFWQTAPGDVIKRHTGIPNTAANKMGVILFGNGFTSRVEIFKTDENGKPTNEIDDKASKLATENLEILKKKTELVDHLRNGAVTESVFGHLFAKWSYDIELSEYPIFEIASVMNAELVKTRGITTAIVFKNYHTIGDKLYVHKETHTTNEKGFAMYINKLYALDKSTGSEKEVPLTTITQTANLKDEFVFEGIIGMLAFEKPNKLPNAEFPNCPYGASDYAGAHNIFDALDEVFSEMVSEIRNNKPRRYVPENMIPTNRNGEKQPLDPFVTNYVKVTGDIDQDAQNKIEVTEINDKHESLQKKYDTLLTAALNKMGLSPLAIGDPGMVAMNLGDKSQQEKNKTTLETRNLKLQSWIPFMEKVLLQMLSLNAWIQKQFGVEQEGLNKLEIDFSNCNVAIEFPDYIQNSDKEIIDTWGAAKSSYRVASTETAIRYIHPNWSETQIMDEVNRIRFEEGMSFDNPNNLPELTGISEIENEVENEDEESQQVNPDENIDKKVEGAGGGNEQ